jgi:capsular polysaccharide biosynthesis protein
VPIPYREILLTSRIMETIFDQLRDQSTDQPAASRPKVELASQVKAVEFEMAVPASKPSRAGAR